MVRALAAGVALAAVAACGGGGGTPRATAASRCPGGVWRGDLILRGDDELGALAGCTRIAGGVRLEGAALRSLAGLGAIRAIDGDLTVGPTLGLTSLRGLAVERIGGSFDVAGAIDLGGVYLPSLREVGGDLTIERDGSVTGVALVGLVRVGGDLAIRDLPALEWLDLPALRAVGGTRDVGEGCPRLGEGAPDEPPSDGL